MLEISRKALKLQEKIEKIELQEKRSIEMYTLDKPLPSMDALFGRMVMAPSATLSCWTTGDILEPQLSDPTHRKWPVWLLRFAASKTRLKNEQTK